MRSTSAPAATRRTDRCQAPGRAQAPWRPCRPASTPTATRAMSSAATRPRSGRRWSSRYPGEAWTDAIETEPAPSSSRSPTARSGGNCEKSSQTSWFHPGCTRRRQYTTSLDVAVIPSGSSTTHPTSPGGAGQCSQRVRIRPTGGRSRMVPARPGGTPGPAGPVRPPHAWRASATALHTSTRRRIDDPTGWSRRPHSARRDMFSATVACGERFVQPSCVPRLTKRSRLPTVAARAPAVPR